MVTTYRVQPHRKLAFVQEQRRCNVLLYNQTGLVFYVCLCDCSKITQNLQSQPTTTICRLDHLLECRCPNVLRDASLSRNSSRGAATTTRTVAVEEVTLGHVPNPLVCGPHRTRSVACAHLEACTYAGKTSRYPQPTESLPRTQPVQNIYSRPLSLVTQLTKHRHSGVIIRSRRTLSANVDAANMFNLFIL